MRNPTLAAAIAITAYIISNPQPLLAQPQLTAG
jgi:hypothetical protein